MCTAPTRRAPAAGPASRATTGGVHRPRATARKAKAWPAIPDATDFGRRLLIRGEPAMRGPRTAVPNTAASRAMASAAAPKRPRGALTSPAEATKASPPSTQPPPPGPHALSMATAPDPQPEEPLVGPQRPH